VLGWFFKYILESKNLQFQFFEKILRIKEPSISNFKFKKKRTCGFHEITIEEIDGFLVGNFFFFSILRTMVM